jgi:hypothetical protein
MGFTTSKDLIELLQQRLGIDERLFAVQKIWEKELLTLARYAEIDGLRRGALIVEVSSNAALHELTLRKKDLLDKINQHFGKNKFIKQIKFKLKE